MRKKGELAVCLDDAARDHISSRIARRFGPRSKTPDTLPRKLVYIVMFLLMMKYGLLTTLSPATAHLRAMARLPASDSPSKEMSSGTSSKILN